MIPKTIHFIWFGNMTTQMVKVIGNAKRLNPDFNINLINELDLDNPTNPDVIECLELCKTHPFYSNFYNRLELQVYFNSYEQNGCKLDDKRKKVTKFSDVFRLYLLNKYGGIYLDLDIEFNKPFDDDLLNRKKFMMSVPSGTNGVVRLDGKPFPNCFFMGSEIGMIDELIESGITIDTNMDWVTILKNGDLIDYTKQPYITHLWGRAYLQKDSIIEGKKRNNMRLQILVPQYKETQEVIKPLLDSIALQQGIDFNEVGVIIVNDGYPLSKLPKKFVKNYPFKIEYYLEEHRGVSGTRNSCLDHATADYVMFCDADDMFFSMVGLNIIFMEMDKGFNSLTTKFYEELHRDGKMWFTEHKNDRTFVHGKFHSRQYLIDNNIRFNEKLTVHEDSYFNMMATTLAADPNSIKYSDVPIYLWKWRDESVCRHDSQYIQKTYNNFLDSMTALIEQFQSREKPDTVNLLICQQMFDTYYLMNTPAWLNQDNQEYRIATEKRFKEFYEKFVDIFEKIPISYRVTMSNSVRASKIKSGMGMEKQTFDQWIEYIKGL